MRLLADSRPRPFALKDKLHFPLQRRQAASAGGVEEGSLLHHPISLALVSFGSKFRFPLPPPLLPFILLAALESSKVHMIESTFPFLRRALPILWSVGIKDDSHRLPSLSLLLLLHIHPHPLHSYLFPMLDRSLDLVSWWTVVWMWWMRNGILSGVTEQ